MALAFTFVNIFDRSIDNFLVSNRLEISIFTLMLLQASILVLISRIFLQFHTTLISEPT